MRSDAESRVDECVEAYSRRMEEYVDSLPVYNRGDDGDIDVDGIGGGVAEESDLSDRSDAALESLLIELRSTIPSRSIREGSEDRLRAECVSDLRSESVYARLKEVNHRRSAESCDLLARRLYSPLRSDVRERSTSMTVGDFNVVADDVEVRFRRMGRGPAVESTIRSFFGEQREADGAFLVRVGRVHGLYTSALEEKKRLEGDVKEKKMLVRRLERNAEESRLEHERLIERIQHESREEKDKLSADHARALDKAVVEHKRIEAEKVAALRADAEKKLAAMEKIQLEEIVRREAKMEAIRVDAATQLAKEIEAREERIKMEEQAHTHQIKDLLEVADKKMTETIMEAEEKRKAEQDEIKKEMRSKLTEAERCKNEEISKREERLRQEEERYQEELREVQEELIGKAEIEREKYRTEIDRLEDQCFKLKCVIS